MISTEPISPTKFGQTRTGHRSCPLPSPSIHFPPAAQGRQLRIPSLFQRLAAILFFLSLSFPAMAQESQPEMADLLRSSGKIYVVVLVILTIFAGIILYMFRLEKNISRLENQIPKEESNPFPHKSNP